VEFAAEARYQEGYGEAYFQSKSSGFLPIPSLSRITSLILGLISSNSASAPAILAGFPELRVPFCYPKKN
jgi:hypothetical protein